MNEIPIEQLLMMIGEQAVEIKILRMELIKLKKEKEENK
jgi:hypothetical protein